MRGRMLIAGVAVLLLVAGCFPFKGGSKDTGRVAGIVTAQATREPIFYAAVLLEGTVLGAMTDKDGEFTVRDVKPGTYDIRVSQVGYRSTQVKGVVVTVGKTTRITAALSPGPDSIP